MGKDTGLGAKFALDGYDLSGDTNKLANIDKTMQTLEMPGIDVLAQERYPGLLDAAINWTSYFNPANAHVALSAQPRTDRIASYFHRATAGTPAACIVAKEFSYGTNRDKSGLLLGDVKTMANASWLDWCYALTAYPRTDTTGTTGSGVDFGAPPGATTYSFGAQYYLQVFSFTGTSCTIKMQGSSDNGGGDAFADVTGGAFTAVTTAHTSQKISTARNQSMERYQRVVTSGTFTSISFAVAAVLNITDMTI